MPDRALPDRADRPNRAIPGMSDVLIMLGEMRGGIENQGRALNQVSDDVKEGNIRHEDHARQMVGELTQMRADLAVKEKRLIAVEKTSQSFSDMQTRAASGVVVLGTLGAIITWLTPLKDWMMDRLVKPIMVSVGLI